MRIFQVDAFTDTRFSGNPATVVLDAEGLDERLMQAIAREFAHAETAFVAAAGAPDHDVRLRFFNARKEAPFVGHATLAAHAVMLAAGQRRPGVVRQLSGTGIVEVRATVGPGSPSSGAHIEFRQTAPALDAPLPLKSTLRVAQALGLPPQALHEHWCARIARKGATRLLVPVSGADALAALSPNMDSLIALGAELGADGVFAFVCERGPDALATRARMFCPALGIPEDPVSGNAHAMLAMYLWEAGVLGGAGPLAFLGHQGASVGRAGEVSVRLELRNGVPLAVHIGGRAVIVSEGRLR